MLANARVSEISVVSVPVSDQERAKAFYVDALGLELLRDESSVPGMRWVQVAPRGATTSLTLVTWFDAMPAGSLRGLVLRVDDLESLCHELRAKGVPLDQEPKREPWGAEAVIRDPDGNRLVLHQD